MKVVIEIPDDFAGMVIYGGSIANAVILNAVKKGVVLPENHGRLIDADELKKEVNTMTEWNGDIHQIIYKASLDDAQTIIESTNKEGE